MRYLNGNELVSASTDSTLRLWDTQACVNTRVFNGHSNEKNFVGLSLVDDFVACGSETNEVQLVSTLCVENTTSLPISLCTIAISHCVPCMEGMWGLVKCMHMLRKQTPGWCCIS